MTEIVFYWGFGIEVFKMSGIETDLIKVGDYVDINLNKTQRKQLNEQFDGWEGENVRGKILDREVLIDGGNVSFRFLAEIILKEEEDDSEWAE